MKSQLKKLTAIFLSICVVLSLTSVISFAAETTATLSFASTAQRTSQTTTAQVWENDGVKLTNNKSASTNNVIDSSNPVRLYANSQVIVECKNMNKIVFDANSTAYANALKTSIGTVTDATVTVSSDKVTVEYLNPVDSLNIAKLSGQVRLDSITVTIAEAASDCKHPNTTTTTTPAEKTEPGSIIVTCDDCGATVSNTPIDALGCKVTYVVPAGETAPNGATGVLDVTLPEPDALTGDYAKEYEFAGWAEAEVELTDKVPALYDAGQKVTLEDDTTFYAVYKYSEKSDVEVPVSNSYVKKDLGDIVETDTVIITMAKSGTVYALTSINGSSNPPPAKAITVTNNEIASAADEFLWTVENTADGYVFYPNGDTSKWLYTTTSNNGVRVGTGENNHFTVDATSGYLKNIEQGRYFGVYNAQDWRSYTSIHTNIAGQTLAFYVKSVSDGTVTYYTTTLESNTPAGSIDGANVDVGSDLTVNFYVDAAKLTEPTMTFTMDGKEKTATIPNSDEKGTFFAFDGVPPHCMTEIITANLYDGDKLVATKEYSVQENIQALLNKPESEVNAATKQFISNMLYYGAASQEYFAQKNNTTVENKLATEGVENLLAATTNLPEESDVTLTTEGTNVAYFKSANVWFDNVNKLIVNFNELPENTKLFVNGTEVSFDGVSYMTDGILATEFDTVYTFELVNEDAGFTQTLTYSVNSYVHAINNSATASANMKALALALYNYGASAELVNS